VRSYTPFGGDTRVLTSFAQNPAAEAPAVPVPLERRSSEPIRAFAAGLVAVTGAFALSLIQVGAPFAPVWAILALGGLAIFVERQPVRLTPNLEITVSFLPVVFAAVALGPLAAMAIVAIGLATDFRRPYVRWVIWMSMRALAAGLAGSAASAVLAEGSSFGVLAIAVTVAALTYSLVDAGLGSLVVALRGTGGCLDYLQSLRPVLLGTVPLYAPLTLLLVYAYEQLSSWSLFLFFAPAFVAHRLHGLYREQRETTDQLSSANERLSRANLSFATALVAALDARDQYTAGHSAAVAVYARDIAERMGLTSEEQQLVHLCGLVHDIGKVGLPAGLLEKPGALTLDERRHMEEHSVIGERILANVEDYAEIARIVRHHHERMDGNGYPDRLLGEEIPILSRIIAVADAYNAMTSGRPYRDAMPSRVARFRLAQATGTQFDTAVVAAFEAILAGASETYLSGVRPDFAIEAQRQPSLVPHAVENVA
jgi:putative nucleotidyltransferase with HDIG domain